MEKQPEPRCFMMLASHLYVDSYVTVDVQISDVVWRILLCYITTAAGVACKNERALCSVLVSRLLTLNGISVLQDVFLYTHLLSALSIVLNFACVEISLLLNQTIRMSTGSLIYCDTALVQ